VTEAEPIQEWRACPSVSMPNNSVFSWETEAVEFST